MSFMSRSILPCLLPIVLLAPLLASCGPEKNTFAPACPAPIFVRDLADLSRYRPGARGQDLTELVVQARLVRIDGNCIDGDRKLTVSATVTISLEALRGPAMTGNSIDLPLFIAVTDGEAILVKREYGAKVEFPSNLDRVAVTSPEIELILPVTQAKSAAAYSIIAGFQLSPEELATNRHRAAR
jgi:hypothetical protein